MINAQSAKNYTTAHAKHKFLRMPLACIPVPVDKGAVNFLIDKDSNYTLIASILKQINETNDLKELSAKTQSPY